MYPDPSPKLGDTDNILLFKIAQILDSGGGGGGGGAGVVSFNTRTGAITLTSGDVTTALGFTPAVAGSGVISFNTRTGAVTLESGDVTTALGFTPAVAGSGVTSFNTRTGAVTLLLADVSTVADSRYVLKAGDTMTGLLTLNAGVNVISGQSYDYNGVPIVRAQTALANYFFGSSGNLTMTGTSNVAMGDNALPGNTTGAGNMAVGTSALQSNDTGSDNVAVGDFAQQFNITGSRNVAIGSRALQTNENGSGNIVIGAFAGDTLVDGSRNIIIGDNIDAPNDGASNQLALGNIIFGTGLTGTGTTIAGLVGIGTNAPNELLSIAGGNVAVYNFLGSSTDFERLDFQWAADVAQIWTEKGSGGGTARPLVLGADATELLRFGSATTLSFFAATAVVKQTSGANLTNSVTAGGTDNTIANFTDLTVYANDAATIRNDIYQLARKLKQINDGLRAYGLFT